MQKTTSIKDFSNYTVSTVGDVFNKNTGKQITTTLDPRGYKYCTILNNSGKWIKKRIHVIVGDTFLAGRKIHKLTKRPTEVYNHIDGNKFNNSVSNLEPISYSANTKHWHDNKHLDSWGGNKL